MVHEEGPGDGLGIPAELSGIGQPVPAESPLPPLYQAAGEADPVPGPVASPQAPAAETLGGPADLEPAATIAERGVQAAGGEEPDPDETAAELTTTGSEPPKPVREDTALTPGRQPATTVPEPAQPPEKTPGRVVPQPRAAEAAQPDPDETAAQPPAVPTVIAAHDRLEVAANAKGGNGSGDGASRQPGRHERPGEPDRGDGEAGRTGSDGPGGGGPETPSSGEFDETPERRLVAGIAGQWRDDAYTVGELVAGVQNILPPSVGTPHFPDALRQAYENLALELLQRPGGEDFDEVSFAGSFTDTPFFEEWLATQGLGGGANRHNVIELYDALQTGDLVGLMAVTRYSVHEHGRILQAVRSINPDDPAQVYADPALFAQALVLAYPDGPEGYVRLARLYANTWDIAHATDAAIDREAGRALEAGSTEPYESIAATLAEILPVWDYVGQALGRPGVRQGAQDHVNRVQLSLRLAAAVKVEEIWGPAARASISTAEQRWLDPDTVGTSSEEPMRELELQEETARLRTEGRLRRMIIGAGLTAPEPESRAIVERSALFAAQRVSRIVEAPMEEVIAQAQAYDLLATIQEGTGDVLVVQGDRERLLLRRIREDVAAHGRLEDDIAHFRASDPRDRYDVQVGEGRTEVASYETFIRAELAARVVRLAALDRTTRQNEREPLHPSIGALADLGIILYFQYLERRQHEAGERYPDPGDGNG